jgi:pilus assembly protein CpaE
MTEASDEGKIRVIIVDDIAETRENIRKLLQFEADIEVVGVAMTGAEGIQVAVDTKPDVVLMDINMPDMDGITATERIRSRLPSIQIVILSVQSDSNYMRRAMLAGARDFLTKPPDVDELTSAIRRAGEMSQQEKLKEATTMAAVKAAGPGTSGLIFPSQYNGKIIAVYSPKGGTGGTTITANLGVVLQSQETPVAVVDGRLQYGDLSFFFNEQGRNNVVDLAPRSDMLDTDILEEVLISHDDTGINILAAPPRPEQAENVTGEQFSRILRYIKSQHAYVLVDTDSSLNDITLAAIDVADLIVLVTTQDIPSIKNVRLFLDLMDALGLNRQQIVLVMNRFDKRRSITPDRVSDISKQEVVAVLPVDERLVVPAMDRGVPFIIQNQNNSVSKGIQQLARGIKKRIEEIEKTAEDAIGI